MSTEIYLRIIKDTDPADDVTGASLVAKLMSPIPLPGVIGGDSLDMPFIKWMKLTGFKNSIGFDSGTVRQVEDTWDDEGNWTGRELRSYSHGTKAPDYADARGTSEDAVLGDAETSERWGLDRHGARKTRTETRESQVQDRYGGYTQQQTKSSRRRGGVFGARSTGRKRKRKFLSSFDKGNPFINIELPSHNSVSFTKRVDNATPQLAYACSCQEPIGTAMVLFRRRIGLGVRGIRVPFLAVLLSKCLIEGWELNGEEESCDMSYKEVRWCTYDQMADFNIATGMSARKWDVDSDKGGESALMYGIMGGIAAAAMAGALTDTIASAASSGQGDTFSGGPSTERGDCSMIE